MVRTAITFLFLLLAFSSAAQAAKRVALVIGNAAYKHAGTLVNTINDAADIGAALKKLDFQVVDGFNLDKAATDRKIREFATALEGAEAGLFFYSGHGLQVAGQNYIVPLELEMVRLDVVHRIMERLTNTNILILDACRNNPLARNLQRAMGTRAVEIGKGLAAAQAGVGTLIAFSTQPDNVALDGTGRNSPFSGPLVKHLSTSKDDLNSILISVRTAVVMETQGRQVPWEHSALMGRFYFHPMSPPTATPTPPPPSQPRLSEAAEAWDRTRDSTNIAILEAFATRFKDTFYADLARARVTELTDKSKVISEPPKPRVDTPKPIEPPVAKSPEKSEATAKVAALPKADKKQDVRQFDGAWMMSYKTGEGCPLPWSGSQPFTINNGVVGLQNGGGRVTASGFGSGHWVAPVTGTPLRYQVRIRGNSGSGTYVTKDNCRGVFTVRRN